MYENGLGVERDYNKAKKYYEIAIEYNNLNAFNNLGYMYENGHGVAINFNKAVKYYEIAMRSGNISAFNNLKNISDKTGCPDASYIIGESYFSGNYIVKQDYQKAIEYFERSAKCGNYDAPCKLEEIYEYGIGVKKDFDKAKEYFILANAFPSDDRAYIAYKRLCNIETSLKNETENYCAIAIS